MTNHRVITSIRTPEDLGIAYLGSPHSAIVPVKQKHRVDRAEYGRRLAEAEGGVFTPLGYIVPRKRRRADDAA
jgi:hypothetical protein